MSYVLSLFNTGQITLPKKWRSKFETKKYTAEETDEGLLIKPLFTSKNAESISNENLVLNEYPDGAQIIFKKGIDADFLATLIEDSL